MAKSLLFLSTVVAPNFRGKLIRKFAMVELGDRFSKRIFPPSNIDRPFGKIILPCAGA